MSQTPFCGADHAPDALLAHITDLRVKHAAHLRDHALTRRRRETLTHDGKLVILAADHPARLVTGALNDPLALTNRQEYLGRILRVLTAGHVDGLMGTPDVIEDVLAVDYLRSQHGAASLLDDVLLIGCLNRGGLAGTSFEMSDAFTAYDAAGLEAANLDGAKLMFRLDPDDPASGQTILWCAEAINQCLDRNLPVFLEPLLVRKQAGKYAVQKDVASLASLCGVAAALGRSSLLTWLKLPYGPDYARVARATTLPILMLGGEAAGNPLALLRDMREGMNAGANVRGALVGRNVLYPGPDDPAAMAAAVSAIVHDGLEPDAAWAQGQRVVETNS